MEHTYSVAVSYGKDVGWISYDEDAKKAEVHLAVFRFSQKVLCKMELMSH